MGILISILGPKFTDAVRKTHEGRTKGYLGSLRSVLAIYFGDMDGYYPVGADSAGAVSNGVMTATVVPKYIKEISDCYTPIHHGKSNQEANEEWETNNTDGGCWGYDGAGASSFSSGLVAGRSSWGSVWVACSHTDMNGKTWSSY